jgi:F0F1-type ATP synthase beta subunit
MEAIVIRPRRGTVHSVHDAVVDIRFAPETLPIPTSLLISTGDEPAHLRVVAQLDRETVRALRSPASTPITIGSAVTTVEDPGPDQPLDLAVLHRVLDQLAPRTAEPHGLIETGIKVINVFCPLRRISVRPSTLCTRHHAPSRRMSSATTTWRSW